jgi:hypothetical protein
MAEKVGVVGICAAVAKIAASPAETGADSDR